MIVVRYRSGTPHLDALLAAGVVERSARAQGKEVRMLAGNTLLEEDDYHPLDPARDQIYLMGYGELLTVPYLRWCCSRYAVVHVYDNYARVRQVPSAANNLSVHNAMNVAVCEWVARDLAFTLSATQQSLFAYVSDACVLHTASLPLWHEFKRGAQEFMRHYVDESQPSLALDLEPATLIESGKAALRHDERDAQRLRESAVPFGKPPCVRLVQIHSARQYSALHELMVALLNGAAPEELPLLVAVHMDNLDMPPYILLRGALDPLGLRHISMGCAEWESFKRLHSL